MKRPKEGSRLLNDLRSFIVHDSTQKTPQTLPLQDLVLGPTTVSV